MSALLFPVCTDVPNDLPCPFFIEAGLLLLYLPLHSNVNPRYGRFGMCDWLEGRKKEGRETKQNRPLARQILIDSVHRLESSLTRFFSTNSQFLIVRTWGSAN